MKPFTVAESTLNKLQQTLLNNMAVLAGKRVVLVDYPFYHNLGDWLIYHGTLHLLKQLRVEVIRQYCLADYQALLTSELPPDVALVLQGGGNFGDIYPTHQQLRREVIKHFKSHTIVMMPQSIHFNQPESFNEDAELFAQHGDLHLHVRDHASLAFLQQFPALTSQLTPDIAYMLSNQLPGLANPQKVPRSASDTLMFRRRDVESTDSANGADVNGFDWCDVFTRTYYFQYRCIRWLISAERRLPLYPCAPYLWQRATTAQIAIAVDYFNRFQCVDTDRLHGMILATMLRLPVVARDNSYGKLARFKQAWLD